MSALDQTIFRARTSKLVLLAILILLSSGCDRMITPHSSQLVKDGEVKAKSGDYAQAIAIYEKALDGTAASADVHYRLALLYDDKLTDPLHALHHFKRYLTLAPNGTHASDVKNFMKRDELALVTSASGDAVVTRSEASRLRNENLALHKQLEEERNHAASAAPGTNATGKKPAVAPAGHGGRTYVVRKGDTLASISRKFYKTSARWKRILDANHKTVDDPQNLKVGETLTIP